MTASPDCPLTKEHFGKIVAGPLMMSPDDAAAVLRCHVRTITRLFEQGDLLGIEINAGAGERKTRRIHRGSVCLLLLRTATYEPADYVASIVLFLNSLGLEHRSAIRDSVGWMKQGTAA